MANPYNQENDEIEIDLGAIFMMLIRKIPMMIKSPRSRLIVSVEKR